MKNAILILALLMPFTCGYLIPVSAQIPTCVEDFQITYGSPADQPPFSRQLIAQVKVI
ncbi:MAG: hypothetical protein QHH17_07165 [Candidatus Bathyarchaeota archaeon]|jgi:hypothetical protein|nr:hypothetical protein [Candidatus Bathyarchaeota archaeon]